MTNLCLRNSKVFFPFLLPVSIKLSLTRTPFSGPGLFPSRQPKPPPYHVGCAERSQGKDHTHACDSHIHSFSCPSCCNSSEYEHQKKEDNDKGEKLVKTSSCQASSQELCYQEKKRETESTACEGRVGKAMLHHYPTLPALTSLSLHNTKAPNSAHLSPLLSQNHFPNTSCPLKH